MIFTTAAVPYRTVPTELFKNKGDFNGYPGSVIQSRVTGYATTISTPWRIFTANLPHIALAKAQNVCGPLQVGALFKSHLTVPIPYPQVGVNFREVKDDVESKIKQLGFVNDTHGKTHYYRGTLQNED